MTHDQADNRVVIPYQFRSVSINNELEDSAGNLFGRNPLSIQVCFNSTVYSWMKVGLRRRNPLSIQVCFNWGWNEQHADKAAQVVIPYQFRSVSIYNQEREINPNQTSRNPLSIQVCFNPKCQIIRLRSLSPCRNPLSIQVCFNALALP